MMQFKNNLSEYTEQEFTQFVELICDNELSESEEDKLVSHFSKIVDHPDGTDLIFWPKDGQDDSPKGIVAEVKRWRTSQGLPCFKD
ncbi:bacteriocin immunity protein [Vibrio mangrovi]|uniref:Bacteriocin immunity protein n=2 Tax=Vibrio mangrovi TaxID=474394 RepID=A0ABU4I900_9VIBR|nr:bacteriocin immunity protein [Vibrio mangrovi]MDW6004436.1 bacteriocin immunity protein [Vibrio mangrovi]MDW6004450.1 bacteriocin immunity protein [Vibrio mangrovi]